MEYLSKRCLKTATHETNELAIQLSISLLPLNCPVCWRKKPALATEEVVWNGEATSANMITQMYIYLWFSIWMYQHFRIVLCSYSCVHSSNQMHHGSRKLSEMERQSVANMFYLKLQKNYVHICCFKFKCISICA